MFQQHFVLFTSGKFYIYANSAARVCRQRHPYCSMAASTVHLMDLPTEVITKICEKLFTRSETCPIDYYPLFEPRHSVLVLTNLSGQALRCCSRLKSIGTTILYASNIFAMKPRAKFDTDGAERLKIASRVKVIQRLSIAEGSVNGRYQTLAQFSNLRFLEIVLDLRVNDDLPWPCKMSQEERDKGEWKHAFLRDERGLLPWASTSSNIVRECSNLAKRGVEVVISGREVDSVQREHSWSSWTYTYHPRRVSHQPQAQITFH